MTDKRVLVIGAGVAGLSAAVALSKFGIPVDVIDVAPFAGGHAIRFACKATDSCVKCGACIAEEKLTAVMADEQITLFAGSRITSVKGKVEVTIVSTSDPKYIDSAKCSGCGKCLEKCPVDGAVVRGTSRNHFPMFAIRGDTCRYLRDGSCRVCREICPEDAIRFERNPQEHTFSPQAVVLATGFKPFDPTDKPYGYGVFKNVITNLDLEESLRKEGQPVRPSDNEAPGRIAFIQCVGSRDSRRNHLWCSSVCCGSSIRMARKIKAVRPDTEITVFYIDIQTFGKDFGEVYQDACSHFQMVRSIPGDIYPEENDTLRVSCFEDRSGTTTDRIFDLVVLSVGMVPRESSADLARHFGLTVRESGFITGPDSRAAQTRTGVFPAGTVIQPMGIAEAVASGTRAAWQALKYIQER